MVRQKQALEAEIEKLKREAASSSFKLAWEEERAAHQRHVASSATTLAQAEERARLLREELEGVKAERDDSVGEAARCRDDARRLSDEMAFRAREAEGQVRALQRQVSHLRAEKGALCEEFGSKLEALVRGTGIDAGLGDAGVASLREAIGDDGGAYEELSVFTDGSGLAALQMRAAMD